MKLHFTQQAGLSLGLIPEWAAGSKVISTSLWDWHCILSRTRIHSISRLDLSNHIQCTLFEQATHRTAGENAVYGRKALQIGNAV
jgi:hypothetical protein